MAIKKYPVGTKIRFLYTGADTNKEGTIVGITYGLPDIYVPTADKHIKDNYYPILPGGIKYTWHCRWEEIEPLTLKGQQLLFDFMGDD